MGLGLLGLALVAPSAAWADPGPADASMANPQPRPVLSRKPRLCPQCHWKELRAQGINAPPPPPVMQGGITLRRNACEKCGAAISTIAAGNVNPVWTPVPAAPAAPIPAAMELTHRPAPAVAASTAGGNCVACEAAAGGAPGHAVVGGHGQGQGLAGHAVVGGTMVAAEPVPIGVIQGRYAYQTPNTGMAVAAMPMPGAPGGQRPNPAAAAAAGRTNRGFRRSKSADPAVMPSSFSSSNDPYLANDHNRPHVFSHLFGLDAIGHRRREELERRAREQHASIRYQPANEPVVDVPASMVYGR
jgi:hypothetical protein